MREKTLLERQQAAGARLVEGAVIDYGDFEREYRALRERAGLIDRSARGKLLVTGRDRLTFLDAMLSQALAGLTPGQGRHAAFLTTQGRVIVDLIVHVRDDDVLLTTPDGLGEKARAGLRRYVISEDAKLRDVSDELALLAVHGPQARDVIGRLVADLPTLAGYDGIERTFEGEPLWVARSPELGIEGFHLYAPATLAGALWDALLVAGREDLTPVGEQAAETVRIEAGVPRYGIDFDEQVILSEAELEDAVSYNKGCYLGQEVIARIKFRGHVNRHLAGLRLEGAAVPPPGALIHAGDKEVGRVTSAVLSPAIGQVIALGYVRREAGEPGTRLAIRDGDMEMAAEVVARPVVPA